VKIGDNDVLNALWPKDPEGSPAPRPIAQAFASLCAGQCPDNLYCARDLQDETSTWRALAVVGPTIVEVSGTGDDLWTLQRVGSAAEEPTVTLARCAPFDSAVRSVQVIATQPVQQDQNRWFARWRIELDTGNFDLPSAAGLRRSYERDAAEEFALAVLARLHGRPSA